MRYTGLLTILAILGLGSLLISDFSKPTHAEPLTGEKPC